MPRRTKPATAITVDRPEPDPRADALRDAIRAAERTLERLGYPREAWRTGITVVPSGSGCALGVSVSGADVDTHPVIGPMHYVVRKAKPWPTYQKLRRLADALRRQQPALNEREAMALVAARQPRLVARYGREWSRYAPRWSMTREYAAAERAAVAAYGLANLDDPRAMWAVSAYMARHDGANAGRVDERERLVMQYGATIAAGRKVQSATKRAREARRTIAADLPAILAADRAQVRARPHVTSKLRRATTLACQFAWGVEAIRKKLPVIRRNRQ